MAISSGAILIGIKANLDDLKRGIDKTSSELRGLSSSFKSLFIAGGVVSGIVAVGKGMLKMADAAGEAEAAAIDLRFALEKTGQMSQDTLAGLVKYANELQNITNQDNDAIVAGMAYLVTMGATKDKLKELTLATLDFSASTGIGLPNAFQIVGRNLSSKTNLLSRYGIELRHTDNLTDKLAESIEALNRKFGGSSAKNIEGYKGKVTALGLAWSDLIKTMGAPISDAISPVLKETTTNLKTTSDWLSNYFESLKIVNQWILDNITNKSQAGVFNDANYVKQSKAVNNTKEELEKLIKTGKEELALMLLKDPQLNESKFRYDMITEAVGRNEAALKKLIKAKEDQESKEKAAASATKESENAKEAYDKEKESIDKLKKDYKELNKTLEDNYLYRLGVTALIKQDILDFPRIFGKSKKEINVDLEEIGDDFKKFREYVGNSKEAGGSWLRLLDKYDEAQSNINDITKDRETILKSLVPKEENLKNLYITLTEAQQKAADAAANLSDAAVKAAEDELKIEKEAGERAEKETRKKEEAAARQKEADEKELESLKEKYASILELNNIISSGLSNTLISMAEGFNFFSDKVINLSDGINQALHAMMDDIRDYFLKLLAEIVVKLLLIAPLLAMFGVPAQAIGTLLNLSGIGKYAKGISNVPFDMPAMVHKGEQIVPASQNPANGGVPGTSYASAGSSGSNITINLQGIMIGDDTQWQNIVRSRIIPAIKNYEAKFA